MYDRIFHDRIFKKKFLYLGVVSSEGTALEHAVALLLVAAARLLHLQRNHVLDAVNNLGQKLC